MAVERAGERIAACARQQVLVAFAIGQRVEDVPDAQCAATPERPLEIFQVDGGEHAVERDRAHLGGPAADQHRQSGAGEYVQSGEEHHLVESEHQRPAQEQPREHMVAEPGARALVEQDDDDAIEEQDRRSPHHQRAHLVEEAEIGGAAGHERNQRVMTHDEGEREQQHVAEQQAVDRLAHHHRVLADVEQEQHHQLAGEQHGRARRGDDAERQRDVEDAGEIGLEKVHHPERAEEGAEPNPGARAQQGGKRGEIEDGVPGQQHHVVEFRHCESLWPHVRPILKVAPATSGGGYRGKTVKNFGWDWPVLARSHRRIR